MKAAERREAIIRKLKNSAEPLSGAALAQELGVSRQVIVQDISILRAQGNEVLSTNRGYVLQHSEEASRVFKVIHTEEEIRKEFSIIVDCGGRIRDEFVYHKVYGTMRGELNIRSRLDIENYLKQIREGQSRPLMRGDLRVSLSYRYGGKCPGSGYDPGKTGGSRISGTAARLRTGGFPESVVAIALIPGV